MRGISGGGRGAAPWGRDTWMRFDGRCGGCVPTGERIKSRRGAGPRRAPAPARGRFPVRARDEGRGGDSDREGGAQPARCAARALGHLPFRASQPAGRPAGPAGAATQRGRAGRA